MKNHPFQITWRQFGGIVTLCTVVGVSVGVPVYVTACCRLTWPYLPIIPYLPILVLVACVVAAAFATVAALFASIVLILLARYGQRSLSPSHLIWLGVLSGALLGALHPFHERHGSKDWEGEHPQEH